jgi:sugar phosphate isomerase/epimerase
MEARMSQHRYSVQLYTLREMLADDLDGTLERVAAMGFHNAELWRIERYQNRYKSALARTGIRPLSAHATALVDGDAWSAIRAAAELGVGTLIESRIDAARWVTRRHIEAAAEALNAVAKHARREGVMIGYHNHDHEVSRDFDGRTGLELFAEALDDHIVLEVDTFWAEVGGVSAADLLARLGARVTLIHLKDGPYSTVPSEQQPLGEGVMPVIDILKATPDAVRVVELDDYAGDTFDAVEKSLRYLERVDG